MKDQVKKVLITDYVHSRLVEGLTEMGYQVEYDQTFSPERLVAVLPELYGIVINTRSVMNRERIERARNLEFIARLGSGLDIIDLEAAGEKGIHVINTPEANCDAVAEHAIGMLLCLNNNLFRSDLQVRQKIWKREDNRGFELKGKTIGIVGMGNTGRALASKLSRWGLEIIFNDPYVYELPEEYNYLSSVDFDQLVSKADIISFHVQLTDETKHMANASFFEKCKKGLVLVNTSRGAVVDTQELVKALENGKLGGACLDVFENEKPHSFTPQEDQRYKRLYEMSNVVLSPHVAGWTHESLLRIAEILLEKLKSIVR